jgi:hypothetical protein
VVVAKSTLRLANRRYHTSSGKPPDILGIYLRCLVGEVLIDDENLCGLCGLLRFLQAPGLTARSPITIRPCQLNDELPPPGRYEET